MNYPAWIEEFWLQKAREHWGVGTLEELAEVVRPHVARLSDLFTLDRPAVLPDYATDPAVRIAYGLFFFPQTYARTLWVLDECFNTVGFRLPSRHGSYRLLDLGAGSGAASFAALHFFSAFRWYWKAVDVSAAHLEDLRALAEAGRNALPGLTLEIHAGDFSATGMDDERWDLILISFALNEWASRSASDAHELLRQRIQRLAPGGLLVVCEPASQDAAECLEAFRDILAREQCVRILAPCPHARPCPLLAERRFWCHEVRAWRPPPSVEIINRKLYRDLSCLKFAFLVVANVPPVGKVGEPTAAHARLIAPVAAERGKLVTRGCAEDGNAYTYEILTRHLSAESRAAMLRLERGTRVTFDGVEVLRGNTIRAREVRRSPLS